MATDYVHLHVHTMYSLEDGTANIIPLVKKARESGMKALAITDSNCLFGVKEFYDACHSKLGIYGDTAPIKSIIGCEVSVKDRNCNARQFHLCLHAKNKAGYRNLMKFVSAARNSEVPDSCMIDNKLLEKYHEGLHCSSGCINGEIAYYLDPGNDGGDNVNKARDAAMWYRNLFGNDFSLEVQLHPSRRGQAIGNETVARFGDQYRRQLVVAERMIALGKELGIRVIATNNVHFVDKDDVDGNDVVKALYSGKRITDLKCPTLTGEEWLKTGDEMAVLFEKHTELLSNTIEVADMVEDYPIVQEPDFPVLGESVDDDYKSLREKALVGAKRRWGDLLPKYVVERLEFELETFEKMHLCGYILLVADYVRAAREMGLLVGPGRGSAPGSAVVYAIEITSVNPFKHNLLFERFLNPDRISVPDIDVDIEDGGQQKVIDYLIGKYGTDRVAYITTFGKSNLQPGIYACGIVISSSPLNEVVPVMRMSAAGNALCTQFGVRDIEAIGLLKYDILGLPVLNVIKKCQKRIRERHGIGIDLDAVPDDDKATFELFARGDTNGVFQFESAEMQKWLRILKPDLFSDLVAMNAMFRPGPMKYIGEYITRKHGKKYFANLHPLFERYTSETYEMVIYQEQLMMIARSMAGFTCDEADTLRKAISKIRNELLDELKPKFVAGCIANQEFRIGEFADENKARECAEKIYAELCETGKYAYTKAHAVCYARLAYETAYLKTHYPEEFDSVIGK